MAKKRPEKQQEVDALHQELLRVSSLVLTGFQGLDAQQDTNLRRLIENTGGKYRVVKNTLAKRAAQDTPAQPLFDKLQGPNSIAYTEGDPVALAKALSNYSKENPAFSFRTGVVEGRVLSFDELQALAVLPTREELYAKLLGLLQAPAQRLATLLGAPAQKLAALVSQAEKENKFSQATPPEPAS